MGKTVMIVANADTLDELANSSLVNGYVYKSIIHGPKYLFRFSDDETYIFADGSWGGKGYPMKGWGANEIFIFDKPSEDFCRYIIKPIVLTDPNVKIFGKELIKLNLIVKLS